VTAPRRGGRPWTPVEVGLLLTLAYLVLLIALAGSRLTRADIPVRPAAAAGATTDGAAAGGATTDLRARLVAENDPAPPPARTGARGTTARPAASGPQGAGAPVRPAANLAASCVGPHTVPRSYAGEPGVEAPLAFGPPVEPDGPRPVEAVNGTLIQRVCGGIPEPGQPYHPPDRRLFVALDAVVNGRDPNRAVSRAEWAAGVDGFITRDARWTRARIVTRDAPIGTRTYGMLVRPGQDPLVVSTRLVVATRSRYLLLPVRRAAGGETALILRLACGFQPTFPPA
jgi:hypothetical protein